MDRIRAKIRELLELVAAEQDCSIGIVLAEDDDDGDTAYSFFIKGYPEDVAVGADGLSAVAEGEQRKLNSILESPFMLEDDEDEDEDYDDDDDEDDDEPLRGVN